MSPTSYQAAPPREVIIADAYGAVKPATRKKYLAASPLGNSGAGFEVHHGIHDRLPLIGQGLVPSHGWNQNDISRFHAEGLAASQRSRRVMLAFGFDVVLGRLTSEHRVPVPEKMK